MSDQPTEPQPADEEQAPADEEVPAAEPQPPAAKPPQAADFDDVDDSSADSFPASDPPSWTESSATRNPGED